MKTNTGWRRRVLVLAVATACGVASAAALSAVPAGGHFMTLTHATHLRHGDRVMATVAPTASFHVTVALKMRNMAKLVAYNAKPHKPLSRTTLAADYFPTAAQANAISKYLQQSGFHNIKVSADRMLVSAVGTNAAVHKAFNTNMVKVRTVDGRNAYANNTPIQLPSNLKSTVVSVLGLQTVHMAHTFAHKMTAQAAPGIYGHLTPDFAHIYDASSLPPATDVNVAVLGWGGMQQTLTDLGAFVTYFHMTPPNVTVVCTDVGGSVDPQTGVVTRGETTNDDPTCGGASSASATTEWDLDSQSILGMTGGVKSLVFYSSALGGYNEALDDTLEEIITPTMGEPLAQVVNGSFGLCERYTDANQGGDGSMQAGDQLLAIGVSQGQTFTISTGDGGFDECGDNGMDSANYPASSPYVVAVSGTTLRASNTTWTRENVWNLAGGSPSSSEPAQAWQIPLQYGEFAGMRGPDVAFDANPSSGAGVFIDGGIGQVGGTSLASPLFAGAWARILEGNSSLGFAAPHLYALPASVFHDVTAGNNRGHDRSGGYAARVGWDWATGRGSFDVGKAATALGPKVPE